MALLDLWQNSPEMVRDKHVQQLIAFAGDGRLSDGGTGPQEFRAFLSHISTEYLSRYAEECLESSFPNSGYALQDIMNEAGSRIGATIIHGRYRGAQGHIGFDGLWRFPDGHTLVVEVKTTDAYRIDLAKIASYRKALVEQEQITEEKSSILIIVGRQDTGDLEAQIRGSRFAWDVRIISVYALLRLVVIKEEVEDPKIVQRIHQILIPREFTRLDEIADILFSTAEEIKQEESKNDLPINKTKKKEAKFTPVAFHSACIEKISKHLNQNLLRRSRAQFSNPEGTMAVNCAVSKEHDPQNKPNYWFAFHPHQRDFLNKAEKSYVAFGCGSENQILLIPFPEFNEWLDSLWTTESDDHFYWHVVIYKENGKFILHRKKGEDRISLTQFALSVE